MVVCRPNELMKLLPSSINIPDDSDQFEIGSGDIQRRYVKNTKEKISNKRNLDVGKRQLRKRQLIVSSPGLVETVPIVATQQIIHRPIITRTILRHIYTPIISVPTYYPAYYPYYVACC
ncbi:unnamed protein product [Thelazia callipaeda]|uniref:Uncharacterized protein n=1 Tax=Thelazia callipaeda TaxID=103827 RepID=A0A0N5D371_THECL|nr:unnamed protein product [Thelazia callipaeda]